MLPGGGDKRHQIFRLVSSIVINKNLAPLLQIQNKFKHIMPLTTLYTFSTIALGYDIVGDMVYKLDPNQKVKRDMPVIKGAYLAASWKNQ